MAGFRWNEHVRWSQHLQWNQPVGPVVIAVRGWGQAIGSEVRGRAVTLAAASLARTPEVAGGARGQAD